ncbi:glycosyltransferase [Campylobacter sp. 9BO]|uniref:glycosyltransferase family 32 protein n=1 Tax=Campylobacter sp. 9BO TaxID=3424759 RepID=UPI003D347CD2
MQTLALFVNRTSKILGALVKGFGYIFHFIFPKMRFNIPRYSEAKLTPKKQTNIPKTIWQINYTYKVSLPVYINYLFNRLLSLDWEYRHFSNDDATKFIKELCDEDTFNAYDQLNDGAAKADFFRLFVLNKFGGVYLDIDACFCLPPSMLIDEKQSELFLMTKHRFSNYFMASTPDNKFIKKTIEMIVQNIKDKNTSNGVYALTGPTVLNAAITDENSVTHRHNRFTCVQGSFTNEHFQYIDKPRGKWTHISPDSILK